jgi:hypothetical protein
MSQMLFVHEDNLPIIIARDGTWYWGNWEMKRKDIVRLFSSHLVKTCEHDYAINLNNEVCPVKVEDVPFVIAEILPEEELRILLNDERVLDLPPTEIILKNNVPYCSLFWKSDTKFSRSAFWQLHYYFFETEHGYEVRYRNKAWKIVEQINFSKIT